MIISNQIIDNLIAEAKASPRLRKNYNLHASTSDSVQRMFNAMEPGTIVPIHRHKSVNETMILLRGKMKVIEYDENYSPTSTILDINSGNIGVHIKSCVWHTVEVLEKGTVVFEVKEGPYQPLSEDDIFPKDFI